ncbi:MAG: hypothetical protein AAFO97_14365 [Pseudomonadota bacterium]
MSATSRSNLILGLICIVFATALTFIWIPFDTESGIVEKVRGRFNIGDALAPTVAACFILFGGILLLVSERSAPDQPALGKSHITFIASLMAVAVTGLLVMRFAGPVLAETANLFRAEPIEYRLLRATPGWKHIGFALGGIIMVSGTIAVVERRFSRRGLLTALLAVIAMIVVFDVPFDDLLLPPNGDV